MYHMGVNFLTSECTNKLLCLASIPEDRGVGGKERLNISFENYRAQETHGRQQQALERGS